MADEKPAVCRPDEDIAEVLKTSQRTSERVRQRFVTEGVEAALHPRPQPTRPGKVKIKGNVEQRLLQLACSDPPQGRCQWTLPMLADELVVFGLVDRVSVETVRQALTEIGIMNLQGLYRRLDSPEQITMEITAWENQRNALEARIHWTFTLAVARQKL